jgi:hypothetical protein
LFLADRQTDALRTGLKVVSVHAKYLKKLPLGKGTRDLKETRKESVERLYEIWLKTKMSLAVPGGTVGEAGLMSLQIRLV